MTKIILSTSVIFLVIMAVRKFFRGKAGNVFLYSLWLLFAAGLVIPVLFAVLQDISKWERGRVESPVSIMNLVKTTSLKMDREDLFVQQKKKVAENGQEGEKKQTEDIREKAGKKDVSYKKTVTEPLENNGIPSWMEWQQLKYVLLFIWAIGTITILLCQLLAEKSFRRQLAENREELNYGGQKIYMANGIRTPLLLRGRGLSLEIYLPQTIMENETLIRHAILHENVHRRHGDIWWGYVRNFLVAVYWFYPLVWIAAVVSKRDCEYACDSSVMKDMDRKERISYGNSLLSLIQVGKDRDLFCTATAMKMGKSEMEVRIRMIKRGKERSIIVTVFTLLLICVTGVVAFTDAKEPEKEPAKEQKIPAKQLEEAGQKIEEEKPEQKEMLSAKEAEYNLTDIWGADPPCIYYEDDTRMVFGGCFGLFVYSKETEEIVQSLNLGEIGCNYTQGDHYCAINVSEDGKIVYLHVVRENTMYQYSIDTKELLQLDYKLPDKLYDREKWEKKNKSGIRCTGSTIGDLVYWYEEDGKPMIKYQPLFYKPYGSCEFFKPEDIRGLSEVSFYNEGEEYVITDEKKLRWIEKHFSDAAEKIEGVPACPFYHIMYLKRKDGICGKIFPATDNCSVYQTDESFYDYKEKTNEAFWKLFGIEDMSGIR